MIRVGLTGGIGAGKSTVAKTFIERGAYHVDADRIAREVVEPGTPGLAQLAEAFGPEILDADGALDRAALAARAFVDDESRTLLNSITHPLIGARTQELTDAAPADAVILHDVPLLVEGHMAPFYHLVAVVHADADIRLDRLVNLRGMDADDARSRIAAQATDDQRRAVADLWFDNSGTPDQLAAQAVAAWEERLIPLRDNIASGTAATLPTDAVAYDPEWAILGQRVVGRLWALLGANASAVTHVGPTAVVGQSAVPVIDIEATVADLAAADSVADALAAGGFPRAASSDDERLHVSADAGRPVRVHVRPAAH
ncbi:dephospho-CoA kinase [Gordonia sp. (in: high G+C Gram-positive bacteria)]|uniref:dephospho-CoA kinase n=1 Tax=Gordonia sp. (in: high G+C Gram-positive bacteria) TaxID=84139 RepID=UPI0016B408DF|nr:dephospho-CoA kinase [Gordonia sp. (in: high G+C Gram-positive bacteria)]NLG48470.1 dephospho-CoA kinase [Gordonia sp. (in: high G+C Gram-positive bacteria)]